VVVLIDAKMFRNLTYMLKYWWELFYNRSHWFVFRI